MTSDSVTTPSVLDGEPIAELDTIIVNIDALNDSSNKGRRKCTVASVISALGNTCDPSKLNAVPHDGYDNCYVHMTL